MVKKSNSVQLRDILYELSLAKAVPDSDILDDFIRRYPEHAAALTEFAIELTLDGLIDTTDHVICPEKLTNEVSPAVSRAMSRFQNRLYAFQTSQSDDKRKTLTNGTIANPFANLSKSEFRELAKRLNANSVFLLKIRDCLIDPNTMTVGFQQRVADKLNVPMEAILAHCNSQQQIPVHQRFKADQKPEATDRQTFEEAVQSSGLTSDQQQFLLNL